VVEVVNWCMIYLMHCQNICKCHSIPPPRTTVKEKNKRNNNCLFCFKRSMEFGIVILGFLQNKLWVIIYINATHHYVIIHNDNKGNYFIVAWFAYLEWFWRWWYNIHEYEVIYIGLLKPYEWIGNKIILSFFLWVKNIILPPSSFFWHKTLLKGILTSLFLQHASNASLNSEKLNNISLPVSCLLCYMDCNVFNYAKSSQHNRILPSIKHQVVNWMNNNNQVIAIMRNNTDQIIIKLMSFDTLMNIIPRYLSSNCKIFSSFFWPALCQNGFRKH
jgi:hypothetical protein